MQQAKGFTLVEVLVAMVIFAIVSLAVTMMMVTSTKLASENGMASEAVALAQETLEDLRAVPFANMTGGSTVVMSSKGVVPLNVSWTVAGNSPGPNMNTIVVTVNWNQQGVAKNYDVQSVFANIRSVGNVGG
jgi:prepilin-type N-terminal cleavage/methylation domain-containing protein